jgi:hypothetical protein
MCYWRWQLPFADCPGDESQVHHFEPESNRQRWNDSIRYLQGKIIWRVSCELEETYLQTLGWNIYYFSKLLSGGTTVDFQLYAKTIASLDARLRPLSLTEICRKYCPYKTGLGSTELRAAQRPLKILDGQWYRVNLRVVTSHPPIITCFSF